MKYYKRKILFTSYNTPIGVAENILLDFISTKKFLSFPQSLSAYLYLPTLLKHSKIPAVIISHTSVNIFQTPKLIKKLVQFFVGLDIACLVLDHFTSRGIKTSAYNQLQAPSIQSSVIDAFQGFSFLTKYPFIDNNKISILGISRGSLIADYTSRIHYQSAILPHAQFYSHICICPLIVAQEKEPLLTGAPLKYIVGTQDDLTPPAPTASYVEAIQHMGYDAEIYFVNGHHGFNIPDLSGAGVKLLNYLYDCSLRLQNHVILNKLVQSLADSIAGLGGNKGFHQLDNFKDCCFFYNTNEFWPFPLTKVDFKAFRHNPGKQYTWNDFMTVLEPRIKKGGHALYNAQAERETFILLSKFFYTLLNHYLLNTMLLV